MAASDAPNKPAALRLFFALWPDDGVRAALARLTGQVAGECGGRPTVAANLHITLAFLGNAPAERLADFIALADALGGVPFDLQLDIVGHWRRAGIAWSGASVVPAALVDLAASMKRALEAMAWPVDERPYQPHVTLARDVQRSPRTRTSALPLWRVADFVLVRSTQEAGELRYTPLRRWPLGN